MQPLGSSRGVASASAELLAAIGKKQRTIVIALPGSEELRYLEVMGAFAIVGGNKLDHMILREDARKIEALEEFLHGTQQRLGLVDRLGVSGAEVHVKRFMIRHARLLDLDQADVAALHEMSGE